MTATIPDSYIDLIEGPVYNVLTTIAPNGAPENTVVWSSWDGSHVLVNTADDRRKFNNISANPQVALMAIDPQNPFRWIDIRGTVEEVVDDNDLLNINAHAKLYAGVDEYYGGVMPAEMKGTNNHAILKIRPQRVVAFAPPE